VVNTGCVLEKAPVAPSDSHPLTAGEPTHVVEGLGMPKESMASAGRGSPVPWGAVGRRGHCEPAEPKVSGRWWCPATNSPPWKVWMCGNSGTGRRGHNLFDTGDGDLHLWGWLSDVCQQCWVEASTPPCFAGVRKIMLHPSKI